MTDPRPDLYRALDQIAALVAETPADALDRPTPCEGWDVRTLLCHVVGVHRRIAGAPHDAAMATESVPEVPGDAFVGALAEARARIDRDWADDAVLDRTATVPWGTVPVRVVAAGMTQELVVHAWDLAAVTGRADTLDPSLADTALVAARAVLPAGDRTHVPFGPVVDVPDDAGVYERLVGWLGRDPQAVATP